MYFGKILLLVQSWCFSSLGELCCDILCTVGKQTQADPDAVAVDVFQCFDLAVNQHCGRYGNKFLTVILLLPQAFTYSCISVNFLPMFILELLA